MTVHITALDVSLTATGVATLGNTPAGEWTTNTYRIRTKPAPGDKDPELLERMRYIRGECAIAAESADLVVLEGLAFAAQGSATRTLAGLWWLVFDRLVRLEVPVAVVPPTSRTKWAGARSKAGVAVVVARMWPDADIPDDNVADALALATMGAQMLELELPFMTTKAHQAALSPLRLSEGKAA